MTRTSDLIGIGTPFAIQPTQTPAASAVRLAPEARRARRRRQLTTTRPPHAPLGYKAALQVAIIWRGQILGYKLLRKRSKVTVGSSKRATFTTPALARRRASSCCSRPRRDGYVLRLAPELKGDLVLGGTATAVDRRRVAARSTSRAAIAPS